GIPQTRTAPPQVQSPGVGNPRHRQSRSRLQKDDMNAGPPQLSARLVRQQEREEVPVMAIVGGFDIHRRQVTFDYLDTVTGQVRRGRISPACRETLRHWLERFAGRADVTFAVEGCTGWRFVVEELQRAGITALLAEPAETAHLRGPKRHAKTDKTDSRHLRMLVADGRVPLSWIPPR